MSGTNKKKMGYKQYEKLLALSHQKADILAQRLQALQTANPNPLEFLYSFPSFQHVERIIHQELSEHHIKLEWFKYNDEVKQYIEDIRNGKKEL